MKKLSNDKKGFTLIEVLIACSIMSLITISVMSAATKGIQLSSRSLRQVQASLLLEEGAEAVKSIRDNNWSIISNLNVDTNYYLSFNTNTNTWILLDNPVEIIDGIFTRVVVFSDVYRNNNDDISQSGSLDEGSKQVKVTVSWTSSGNLISKNINFYLINIFN